MNLPYLPPELLLEIADLLPLSCLSSLSLTCKRLYLALGPRYHPLLALDTHHPQRLTFLDLLSRELPSHLLCHVCRTLHRRIPASEHPGPLHWHRYRACEQIAGGINCCQHYYLRFGLVQLAVRARGTSAEHGIPVEGLVHRCSTTTWQGQRLGFELLPKIVDGRFMVRLRYELRVGFESDVLAQTDCLNGLCRHSWGCLPAMCQCAVLHVSGRRPGVRFGEGAERDEKMEEMKKKCVGCRELRRCRICATECQLQLRDVEDDGCSVVVTAWKDLGDAESPMSEPWRSHRSDHAYDNAIEDYRARNADHKYVLKSEFEGLKSEISSCSSEDGGDAVLQDVRSGSLFWYFGY